MSTRVDALRNTLDHLALDPKASEDRRYLVSMLRRLGYSDAEIEAQIGPLGGEPGRVIEVEYEPAEHPRTPGPRSRETTFQVSGPEDGLRFRIADDDAPAGAGVEEVHHTDIAGVESDLDDWGDDFEQGPRDDFTSLGEAPDDFGGEDAAHDEPFSFQGEADEGEVVEFRSARRPDPAVAAGWQEADEDAATAAGWQEAESWSDAAEPEAAWAQAPEEPWPEAGDAGDAESELAWAPQEPEAEPWPEPEADPAWQAEPAPEEWSDAAPEAAEAEAREELVPWPDGAEPETAWPERPQDEAWTGAPAEAEWPEPDGGAAQQAKAERPDENAWEDAAWDDAEAATPAAGPYVHGDYTLYTREVHLSTGREQRIYFFAKSTPQSGEPCPLPDGYEVIENDKTGLPFLRRQR